MATPSLRNRLLAGALVPMLFFAVIETATQYLTLRQTVREAYDRLLIAAVYSVADSLHTEGGQLRGALPLALWESFEAAGGSRVFYRVSTLAGTLIAGDSGLPRYEVTKEAAKSGFRPTTPALQDGQMQSLAVRVAVLYQPVEMSGGQQIAVIQVAHTLEARNQALREAMLATVARQVGFMALAALVMSLVVLRLMRPVERLRAEMDGREAANLSPLHSPALRELRPVVNAFNHLMRRQDSLLRQQERFVADASHQLRTPLTVLKTQLQSAMSESNISTLHGALKDMHRTVERASTLAQQMLSLARVHQESARGDRSRVDLADAVEYAAIELSPLIGGKRLDFHLEKASAIVLADNWMLGELARNLLRNAIHFTPESGQLSIWVGMEDREAVLRIEDSGPGVDESAMPRLFEPFFSSPGQGGGTGLGLAICRDIVTALGGGIELQNLKISKLTSGLRATVRLPAA